MKHICHEAGETKKTLVLHCDSVASRGMAQRVGAGKCRHIEVKRLWLQQATRSDRVKHCRHLDEGADERQSMETDEPDGE